MPRKLVGVRIYETNDDGQREIGQIVLKGGKLVASNKKDETLQYILESPSPFPDESGQVTAQEDPQQFLEGLRYKYTGSRLRAGPVEDL